MTDPISDLLRDWLFAEAALDGEYCSVSWEDHADLNTRGRERAAMLGITWTDDLESATRNGHEPPTADELLAQREYVRRRDAALRLT